jgi:sialate O-acetylesterase
MQWSLSLPLIVLLSTLALAAHADVVLNGLFADHMVLQRGMAIPVWGFAEPGETVTVSAPGQSATTTADAHGNWMIRLDPIETDDPFALTVSANNEIVLQDVMVGDVWICSGQSNMAWMVRNSLNADEEIAAGDHPLVRLCQIRRSTAAEPAAQVDATWAQCSPESVGNFSAVAYFFGREIHLTQDIPVGLISTNWGGTPAEAWTSLETLLDDPDYAPVFDWWEQAIERYPDALETYRNETLRAWEEQAQAARDAGQTPPRRPQAPPGPAHHRRPANLFNAMIHPLIPFAIRGAIWYQGEANANAGGGQTSGAWKYRDLFPR